MTFGTGQIEFRGNTGGEYSTLDVGVTKMMWWNGVDSAVAASSMLMAMVVLGALAVAAVWIGVRLSGGSRPPSSEAPIDILRGRFARGEISESEFEAAKRALATN
jgi:uncharacterized membrane protein